MRSYHNKSTIAGAERGIALVTVVFACAILLALGLLVIQMSTGDLRVSSRSVADKKAHSAAESGIHALMRTFDPFSRSAAGPLMVDPDTDPTTVFTYSMPATPLDGPTFLPMAGYSIGGGQSWGQRRYETLVTGESTAHEARVEIETGIGFGPVEATTMSR